MTVFHYICYITSNFRMRVVLGMAWKEVVVVYLNVLSYYLPG